MAHMLCYLASSQEIVTEYETAIDFSAHTFACYAQRHAQH